MKHRRPRWLDRGQRECHRELATQSQPAAGGSHGPAMVFGQALHQGQAYAQACCTARAARLALHEEFENMRQGLRGAIPMPLSATTTTA